MEENNRLFDARITDLVRRADSGELSVGVFMSPSEIAWAKILLSARGLLDRAVFFGGYGDAERQRFFVLPGYMSDIDGSPEEKLRAYFPDEVKRAVAAIKVSGSGYRELSHRDYLGSLLSLGIERDVVGDIVIQDKFSAVIFCSDNIGAFACTSLERVASDKVSVNNFSVGENFSANREFEPIHATLASKRLDCVVSGLTGLSREKSQDVIRRELCQINYITVSECDCTLDAPCTVSVRGYGKFAVRKIEGLTKKGRLKMLADKYI